MGSAKGPLFNQVNHISLSAFYFVDAIIFTRRITELKSHTKLRNFDLQQGWGYDFRRNMSVSWSDYGKYATDIFTEEAVKTIQGHPNEDQRPLFLYLAHLAVHSANTYSPLQAPYEVVDRFK